MAQQQDAPTLAKTYTPADVEAAWYRFWEQHGFFHGTVDSSRAPYAVVIPPPNVTGVLHMGHILNNTLQDAFVRYKRMAGYEACWIPGTDHAGIATQHVVERALRTEGTTRHALGRDLFVERVWAWKRQYGGKIIEQLRTLGASCDWAREKFTMDETLSTAVREVFVRLYEEGLIYRGKYIVNWCPHDHTAISDDEVTHTEQQGKLWYIRYPLKGGEPGEHLTVATTRPETMLGDTAVAVSPKDQRYAHLAGRTALLPLTGREIPIITDEDVDPAFGTGMVKVTPAHDPTDYLIGQRHGLPQIVILDPSARMNENAPEAYRGLDRFEARTRVLADLEAQGFLAKTEDYTNSVGRCYRCDTVIEPYLSDQWFVKMRPLAEPALAAVANGTIRFFPERWTKNYRNWMENIRDWCISRQLWWGHRIPVWYCAAGEGERTPDCTRPIVSREAPARCPHCGSTALRQDEDVLDTWFSSWLWPFSVHDWPLEEQTGKAADLRYFYPTALLVTAPDIIFFWVARMIMAGLHFGPSFTGSTEAARNIPFRDVYFTSLVRDEKGRKMSKSLGNSPEPMDLIADYGADAVRFTILYLAPLGQDILYAKENNELGRNFANKIWNAGRFLLMNKAELGGPGPAAASDAHADLADRWIVSRLHSTILDVEQGLENYEMNKVAKSIYDFFWHDFCDWYVEMAKSRLYGDEPADVKQAVLGRALGMYDAALRLLHPIMPFVTEELWQHLEARAEGDSIMRQALPAADRTRIAPEVEAQMGFVQRTIEAVRQIRSEMGIAPSREIALQLRTGAGHPPETIRRYEGYLQRLARVSSLSFLEAGDRPHLAASAVVDGEELFVPLEGIIDVEVERQRLRKEIDRLTAMAGAIRGKLGNAQFVARAPAQVVEREREKLASFELTLGKLQQNLAQLS